MVNLLLIFLGSGLGGVLRYMISNGAYGLFGRDFPYGTLFVNTTGCFLMGFLFVFLLERNDIGQQFRPLLLVGFLGGYTTFSSFSIETLNLFENGDWLSACLNVFLSVTITLLLTLCGMILGRQI